MFNPESAINGGPRPVRRTSIAVPLCAWTLLALASAGVGLAAEPSATAASQSSTIAIHDFMFNPMSLVVPVGTTVSWKNLDGEPHTIKSVAETFRSAALDQKNPSSSKLNTT